MLYCDDNVIAVDFKVFDSKVYTFFIEEELLEVHLKRKGDEMFYTFEINKKADTFRNRLRRKIDSTNRKHLWIFIISMISIVLGAAYWLSRKASAPYVPPEILLVEGSRTTGKVFIKGTGNAEMVEYSFVAGNQVIRSNQLPAANLLLETQLPLASGDEFEVYYLPKTPTSNSIFWDAPTDHQVERYLQRVVAHHQSFYPGSDSTLIYCAANAAFQLGGIKALADIYFQKTESYQNPYHNHDTYEKLLADPAYRKILSEQCK